MSAPPYAPPSIGPAGLTIPTYQSIFQDLLSSFLNIYGQNQYVAPDSAIYQLLSIFALKISDVNLAVQFAYNQSSPQTAVGAGLDRVVKMNGLARMAYTFSTAVLTVGGVAGTTITNGFAQDTNGNLWALPSPTVIPGGGTINVTATCTTPGSVPASAGQIAIISSTVLGWTSVTNAAAARAGNPVETDSELRGRQAISVALPALTPLASTVAAVLAVPGVVRVAPPLPTPGGPGSSIENPTGATDSWGNPAHSISIVADGGADAAVGLAIYLKKTIGCLTHGTTSVSVTDPVTGNIETMSFYRPTYTPIFVYAVVTGYTSNLPTATLTAIQAAIVAYLNSLQIGELVSVGALIYAIMALNAQQTAPRFGVQFLFVSTVQFTVGGLSATNGSNLAVFGPLEFGPSPSIGQTFYGSQPPSNGGNGISPFPPGTTIIGISGSTLTMSNVANQNTGVNDAVFFTGTTPPINDVAMPHFYSAAQGLTADVVVVQF
jgi:uncharacterized phage protein gp47/JayE